ncbi:DMT family transporter [Carboxydochorda subterranea]|uniref:DMT family transporter n=1 Tax=Carboxydichorda subterranea TaxID=3109565 RepID=A0ABZ1BUY4_9FIRM|nr:DMT family transporter [Limnochorda sp. L945t]WRP16425.1 DMT family transporter [Limnochorda sp. L945t]
MTGDASDRRAYPLLAVGVAAVSSAAIWVRLSELPPVVLAFYRLAFAAAALGLVLGGQKLLGRGARSSSGASPPPRGWWRWAALAGVSLAAHWSIWFASLGMTSVLSSTVLVTTQPLWVVLLAWLLWRERIGRGQAAALGVALAGSAAVAGADALAPGRLGPQPAEAMWSSHSLAGDALALAAAVLVSVYLLVGQRLRPHVPLLEYLGVVYGAGAATLLGVAWGLGVPVAGWPAREMWLGAGIAAVPTLIGHSALNAVVGRLGASVVATAVLGEPVGASVLALALFGEWPSALHWVGAAMILGGIYLFTRRSRVGAPGEVQAGDVTVGS